MYRLTHSPRLDNSNYTWGSVQIMQPLVMQFSLPSLSTGKEETKVHICQTPFAENCVLILYSVRYIQQLHEHTKRVS
jgi:hypothetical protein